MSPDLPPPSPPVVSLLEQAAWLRGLTAALVRDPGAADDLAQDAWLASIQHPAPGGVPPRAWLAGIARNLARMRFRGSARRDRRERRAATPESLPGPAELAERLETQRRLAGLVAELAEPVRSIVLLRFYEGLDSAEIARRRGEPAGTVRWRLKQGLDELRTRLDQAHGGERARWMAIFAPVPGATLGWLGPRPEPPAISPVPLGGLLMVSTTKLVAGAVAAFGLLAGGLWLAVRPPVAAPPAESAGPTASPDEPLGAPADLAAARPLDAAPGRGGARAPAPAASAAATAEARGAARLVGRVVDAAGAPLSSAVLRVGYGGADHHVGDDARFSIDVPVGGDSASETLLISAPRWALRVLSKTLDRGATTDLGDVPLAKGALASGHVVDDAGAPVPFAWIVLASVPVEYVDRATGALGPPAAAPATPELSLGPDATPASMLEPAPFGPTALADAEGAFALESLPVGVATLLRVGALGHRHVSTVVTVPSEVAGERLRIVLPRLRADEGIEGRVLAPDGSAAADYPFLVQFTGSAIQGTSIARTDAAGRFHLETLEGTTYSVLVDDDRRGWTSARVGGLLPGRRDVLLEARLARTTRIVAQSSDRATIGAFAFTISLDGGPQTGAFARRATSERTAQVLVPGGPFTLEVEAPGFSTTTVAHLDPASVGDVLPVTLQPLPRWQGLVRAAGRPVPGARVSIHRAAGPGELRFTKGFPLTRDEAAEAVAVTDDAGAYEATLRERGLYLVRAEASGFAPGETSPVELDATAGGVLASVDLGAGGAIEGSVRTGGKGSSAGLLVGAARGDGLVLTAKTGPDGGYRFERLTPGPWLVRRIDEIPVGGTTIFMKSDAPVEWNCEVREGVTTRKDLGVGAGAATTIRGRLRGPGDHPWYAALAYLDVDRGQTDDKSVEVGADGAFEIATDRTGDYRLLFMTPRLELQVYVPVRLAPGDLRVDLALDLGSVAVGGVGAGTASRTVVWEGADGAFGLAPVRKLEGGGYGAPVVPAGHVRIVRYDPASKETDPRKWPVDATLEVHAGRTTAVELK